MSEALLPLRPPFLLLSLVVAALQSLVDGAEPRGGRQQQGGSSVGLLQLLLPLEELLPLLQLFLLLLQLEMEVFPLLLVLQLLPPILLQPRLLFVPFDFFFSFLLLPPLLLLLPPLPLLLGLLQRPGLLLPAPLQLQQVSLVLLQPAQLRAERLLSYRPRGQVGTGESWQGASGGAAGRVDDITGGCVCRVMAAVRWCREACGRKREDVYRSTCQAAEERQQCNASASRVCVREQQPDSRQRPAAAKQVVRESKTERDLSWGWSSGGEAPVFSLLNEKERHQEDWCFFAQPSSCVRPHSPADTSLR